VCFSEYHLSARNGNATVILPAGTGVYIPVLGIHFDAMYFPNPEKFDADRFTEDNKRSRPNYTYIPFGDGPRMCIGKGRHLKAPHKNFSVQSLKIKINTIQEISCNQEHSWIFLILQICWETNT
jgi:hypothetical protein